MARKPTIDPSLVNKAQEIANDTKCANTLRLCQSILLPSRIGATLEQIASILGVSRATVPRMQKTFRTQFGGSTPAPPRNWGGRRRQLMSPAEEKAFLQPWLDPSFSKISGKVRQFGKFGARDFVTCSLLIVVLFGFQL